jgi:hypothetical protein
MTYTRKDTIATRYQQELYFDSLDRARATDAMERLRVMLNLLQTTRIILAGSLIFVHPPTLDREDHHAWIRFVTKEQLTRDEQHMIIMDICPRKSQFNTSVGEESEAVFIEKR